MIQISEQEWARIQAELAQARRPGRVDRPVCIKAAESLEMAARIYRGIIAAKGDESSTLGVLMIKTKQSDTRPRWDGVK